MDSSGTFQRPPRWRPWARAAALTLGGLLVAAMTAAAVYGLVVLAALIVVMVAMNGYGSNK